MRTSLGLLALALMITALGACGGGTNDAPRVESDAAPTNVPSPQRTQPKDVESVLRDSVLQLADIRGDFAPDVAQVVTNEEAARQRPDPDVALRQYEEWGQELAYTVQYNAPPGGDLLFSGKTARVTNTATLYRGADGAHAALEFLRLLPADAAEAYLARPSGPTKISETVVFKDLAYPARGDESFAWRVTGKATFADGFTINFIADALFLRVGGVVGNVTTVALGHVPDRDELDRLVVRFIERVKAAYK